MPKGDDSHNDVAIRVQQISKIFKLYEKPIDRLKEALHPGAKRYHQDFYALSDINFSVKRGETVGILGKNGAGKSTLLKIIAGVLTPSAGTVQVNGSVASLLELGAGFNPEYTGIENIFFQGALMGFSREQIATRVDDIVAFADIGAFIHQPIKVYSSGMFARLAFSVAINVEPDVLIVDEALSVGDMAFQEKSITKMKEMVSQNRAILFVSHSLPSIRNFCNRAIWIDEGRIIEEGDAHAVCEKYDEFNKKSISNIRLSKGSLETDKQKSKSIYISDVELSKERYRTGEEIKLTVQFGFNKDIRDFAFGVLIFDEKGHLVTLFNTIRDDTNVERNKGCFNLVIPENNFLQGRYFITVSISDKHGMFSYDKADYCAELNLETPKNTKGIPISEGILWSKHYWNQIDG